MRPPPLAPGAALRWAVVEPLVAAARPASVLEIGCGLGAFGARLADRWTYTGIDEDAESARVARGRVDGSGGRVLTGVPGDLAVDRRFDLVCAFEVLEHLEDDRAALIEWVGRVNPGGTLLLSVPAGPDRFGPWDELVGHHRRYDAPGLEGLLADAGCEQIRSTAYGWPLVFALEAVRDRIAARRLGSDRSTMATRTASSGRQLQPGRRAGAVIERSIGPFAALQRRRPDLGTGLVIVGRRPSESEAQVAPAMLGRSESRR